MQRLSLIGLVLLVTALAVIGTNMALAQGTNDPESVVPVISTGTVQSTVIQTADSITTPVEVKVLTQTMATQPGTAAVNFYRDVAVDLNCDQPRLHVSNFVYPSEVRTGDYFYWYAAVRYSNGTSLPAGGGYLSPGDFPYLHTWYIWYTWGRQADSISATAAIRPVDGSEVISKAVFLKCPEIAINPQGPYTTGQVITATAIGSIFEAVTYTWHLSGRDVTVGNPVTMILQEGTNLIEVAGKNPSGVVTNLVTLTTPVPAPDLKVAGQIEPPQVKVGESYTITLLLTNTGDLTATNVMYTMTLGYYPFRTGPTAIAASGNFSIPLRNLASKGHASPNEWVLGGILFHQPPCSEEGMLRWLFNEKALRLECPRLGSGQIMGSQQYNLANFTGTHSYIGTGSMNEADPTPGDETAFLTITSVPATTQYLVYLPLLSR